MVGLKTQNDLEIALRQNMWLGEILERFEEIVLPDCWLVAGAIAQTIWNLRCEQPAEFGLKDVDLIYFSMNKIYRLSPRPVMRDAFVIYFNTFR